MESEGVDSAWVLNYLPEVYEQSELNVHDIGIGTEFVATYLKNENSIIIDIKKYADPLQISGQIQKDDKNPEIYAYKEINFYIMTNFDKYLAVWLYQGLEGSIFGMETKEELINMIHSTGVS